MLQRLRKSIHELGEPRKQDQPGPAGVRLVADRGRPPGRHRIGEPSPGQRLPSGPEVAAIYGVTKVTATTAIRHLQEAGLLTVVNGMGTYVTTD
ncbi:GntR family transcriptional regulator [Saccharopolyspora shandongensis]|uniref:GntR family transcriptional regulator n=1 Tax=Saccharopolyspora shandongensis TaxID=418495 RepID=UPI0015A6259A